MFLLQRTILVIAAFVLLLLGLGSKPTVVIAPSENLPATIETPRTTQNTATSTTPAANVKTATKTTPPVKTTAQPPVKSLAQAFADLAAESSTTVSAPVTQSTNEKVRGSLVNIICTTEAAGPLNSISASGVFIHPSGVIITNAHVGQYFLLKDYPHQNSTSCIIRTGSPAQPKYTAELLFLPPSWIDANAKKIVEPTPTGNGEHDYALLRVTGTVSSSVTLPTFFPFLPFSIDDPREGAGVLVAGYPAGFLGGITIAKELYSASSFSNIGQLYTFGTNTPDLFSVGGTVVAQQGSSGGAVTDGDGNLFGIITTSTQGVTTASRDLRAVATAYIAQDFEKESGVPFETFMNGNLTAEAQTFSIGTAPTLTKALTNVIESN